MKDDTRELIERCRRWLSHTGFDGGVNSPPALVLNALSAALEREEALRAILYNVERSLQKIYSGDESPVLLRTRIAKCARRYEAGNTLRQLIRARAAL